MNGKFGGVLGIGADHMKAEIKLLKDRLVPSEEVKIEAWVDNTTCS